MDKVTLLKAMHELVMALGDEDLIETWLMVGMGDFPTDEDFEFVANNEESFAETVHTFIQLAKHFKEGIKLFGKWYK